jgi:hypothetical protein
VSKPYLLDSKSPYNLAFVPISIIIGISVIVVILNNNNTLAIAMGSGSDSDIFVHTKGIIPIDTSVSETKATAIVRSISFADDTLFPQTFQSSASTSNEITLSDGKVLEARPTTLTVNKIPSNNTLVLNLHSLNDKYLLNGSLKGSSSKTIENTKDHTTFSLAGVITINKQTSYPVISNLTETTNKQITLEISNTKNSGNFKASIGFAPPSGGEAPLAGI